MAATLAFHSSSSASPKLPICYLFNSGMGHTAHIGNVNSLISALYAEGLALTLYATGRPTRAQKHSGGTDQPQIINVSVRNRE